MGQPKRSVDDRRRAIRARVGRVEQRARELLDEGKPERVRFFAEGARERATWAVAALDQGDDIAAASALADAQDSLNLAQASQSVARTVARLEPDAEHGRTFKQSKRGPAAFRLLLEEVLADLPACASAKEVLERVEEINDSREDDKRVIDEVVWDDPAQPEIWKRGKSKPMSFSSFKSRLSEIRRKQKI